MAPVPAIGGTVAVDGGGGAGFSFDPLPRCLSAALPRWGACMIHLLGSTKRVCGNFSRREMLRVGGLSLLGLSLDSLLRAEDARPTPLALPARRAKSVILLYLFGGPSVQETFDPKPNAPREFRGEFGSIPTSVPGVHFCEYLPRMAKWMHRSTLIRSATHDMNDHSAGLLYTMTGAPPEKLESLVPTLSTQAPSMNSVIEYLSRSERRTMPATSWMPCYPGWGQQITRPGPFAGWLGSKWDPLITQCELRDLYTPKDFYDVQRHPVGRIVPLGTQLSAGISLDRFKGRRQLAEQLHQSAAAIGNSEAYERFDEYQRRAFDILTEAGSANSPWRAFDVAEEKPTTRDRYGRHLYGEAALMARRMVERGARFVTVCWESFEKVGGDPTAWDTHSGHFPIMKDYRLPALDQVYSALCEDLQDRGLLDETLIVVMGEMGRAPKVNASGGRDHWSYLYNILMTGAGVKQGLVYGASDDRAERPTEHPVTPADFIATLYGAMGIDPNIFLEDALGRPRPLTPGGSVIPAILA